MSPQVKSWAPWISSGVAAVALFLSVGKIAFSAGALTTKDYVDARDDKVLARIERLEVAVGKVEVAVGSLSNRLHENPPVCRPSAEGVR